MGEERKMDNWRQMMSPEIVEIGEDSKSTITGSRDEGANDVFIAVGKNDLDVVKWAIDHAVSPGARVYLVHVYPTITYVLTPVGWLSRSQLSKEQVKVFVTEENNRRRNLLQRYILLCTDAKVAVETMLLESNDTAKAILDLIPVLNITNLVMGTKRKPSFRVVSEHYLASHYNDYDLFSRICSVFLSAKKGQGRGEFVQKNAPDFCEVTIVCEGKKVADSQQRQVRGNISSAPVPSQLISEIEINGQTQRRFSQCICFTGKLIRS